MDERPPTPDEIEQRLRADGSYDDEDVDEDSDEPLEPDQIEQRQEVDYDEDDYRD